jgi:hypothetical protein
MDQVALIDAGKVSGHAPAQVLKQDVRSEEAARRLICCRLLELPF